MVKLKKFKKSVGSFKPTQNAPIKDAIVIKGNPQSVEKMNSLLRIKCNEQRCNEAMTELLASRFTAVD